MNVKRLNHAVLWVRDARASAAFYGDALGFQVVESDPSGRAVFMRAGGSDNHHDLGLFSVGERPSPPPQAPGLYHLAWQVDTIEDLAAAAADAAGAGLAGRRDRPRRLQEPLRQGSRRHRVRGHVAGPGGPVGRRTPSTPGAQPLDLAGRAGPLGRRRHGLTGSSRRSRSSPSSGSAAEDGVRGSRQVGWAWTKPSAWSTRGAPAGRRTAARRPARAPSSKRGPNAGTGRIVGRCSTSPSVSASSALVTGVGRREVDRSGRRRWSSRCTIADTSSSRLIQLIHCVPGAEASADAELEQRQQLAPARRPSAPARCPVRRWATRTPAAAAGAVLASHASTTSARKPVPAPIARRAPRRRGRRR